MVSDPTMQTDYYPVNRPPDSPGAAMRASAGGQSYFDMYPERRGQGPYVPKARLTPSVARVSVNTTSKGKSSSRSSSPILKSVAPASASGSTTSGSVISNANMMLTPTRTVARERKSVADLHSPSSEQSSIRASGSDEKRLLAYKSARNLAQAIAEDHRSKFAENADNRKRSVSIQPEANVQYWHARTADLGASGFPRYRGGLRAPEAPTTTTTTTTTTAAIAAAAEVAAPMESPSRSGHSASASKSKIRERLASEAVKTPPSPKSLSGEARMAAVAAASRSPSGYPSMLSSVAKRNSSQDLAAQFRRQSRQTPPDVAHLPPVPPLKDLKLNTSHHGQKNTTETFASPSLADWSRRRQDSPRMLRSASSGLVNEHPRTIISRVSAVQDQGEEDVPAGKATPSVVPATHASSSHALGKALRPKMDPQKTAKVPSIDEIIQKHASALHTPLTRSASTIGTSSRTESSSRRHAIEKNRSATQLVQIFASVGASDDAVEYDSDASLDSIIAEARAVCKAETTSADGRRLEQSRVKGVPEEDPKDVRKLPTGRRLQHATSFPAKPQMLLQGRRAKQDSPGRARGGSITNGVPTTPTRARELAGVPPLPGTPLSPLQTSAATFSPMVQQTPTAPAATEEERAIARYLRSPRLTRLITLQREPYAGLTVSYADVGSATGHPVVIFLGLNAVRYLIGLYDEMAAALNLRLICLDRWGLGRSDDIGSEKRGVIEWSGVVVEIIDRLGLSRFSVLAHSAGAPYAMATCLVFGSRRVAGPAHLLAPWVSASLESGYRWLKYVPDGFIRTAQAAESRVQGWRLGKLPSLASSEDDVEGAAERDDPLLIISNSSFANHEGQSSYPTPRIDGAEVKTRPQPTALNLSFIPPPSSAKTSSGASKGGSNGVAESASSPLLGSSNSFSPSPSSPSLSLDPSTRSSKSPIPRWPSSSSLRASSTPRSSCEPGSARQNLSLPEGTNPTLPSSPSMSSFSNDEDDLQVQGPAPASSAVLTSDGSLRKRAWMLRRTTTSSSNSSSSKSRPHTPVHSQRHGGTPSSSAMQNRNGSLSGTSDTTPNHSPMTAKRSSTNPSSAATATSLKKRDSSSRGDAGDSSNDSWHQRSLSLKDRQQGTSNVDNGAAPTNFDLGTALLRASHAESQRGGGTADLLCILGRASQKPWGFTYADVNHAAKVWHGDKDERVSLGSVLWMERQMSNCQVELVKGAGHGLMTNVAVVVEALESIAACRHL